MDCGLAAARTTDWMVVAARLRTRELFTPTGAMLADAEAPGGCRNLIDRPENLPVRPVARRFTVPQNHHEAGNRRCLSLPGRILAPAIHA